MDKVDRSTDTYSVLNIALTHAFSQKTLDMGKLDQLVKLLHVDTCSDKFREARALLEPLKGIAWTTMPFGAKAMAIKLVGEMLGLSLAFIGLKEEKASWWSRLWK